MKPNSVETNSWIAFQKKKKKEKNLHLILIVRHLRITAPVKEIATHFKTKQKSNNLYWKASNSLNLKAELP